MNPVAVDTTLAVVVTATQTIASMANDHAGGWRGWVPAFGMLAAFVPLLRWQSTPLAHPFLLALALSFWAIVLAIRPRERRGLRRLAMGVCGICIALIELS